MPRRLYLDTARLGLMRIGAQRLYLDFVRLAGEEGCTLYWEDFLRHGWSCWPDFLQARYPELRRWEGITGLKRNIRQTLGVERDAPVFVASRSSMLMKLAAKVLFQNCLHVLHTDLSWPNYAKYLMREQRRHDAQVSRIHLRSRLLSGGMGASELVQVIAQRFCAFGCDGLFLPSVNHLGIRLPVSEIIAAIRERCELRFAVIDGAQALAHVPQQLRELDCDLYLAGCHKWLGAYHPLGLAISARAASAEHIRESLPALLLRRRIDDPLLRFTEELESGSTFRFGETVHVAPLLSAQGALGELQSEHIQETFRSRIENSEQVVSSLNDGLKCQLPDADLRSGIVLLRLRRQCRSSPEELRWQLVRRGIAATTYPQGHIRLSMPSNRWFDRDLLHLTTTLHSVSQKKTISALRPF